MRALRTQPVAAPLSAPLVVFIAGVHFQQYVDFISQVPTVGVLFLLNAAGGAPLVVALTTDDAPARRLVARRVGGLSFG